MMKLITILAAGIQKLLRLKSLTNSNPYLAPTFTKSQLREAAKAGLVRNFSWADCLYAVSHESDFTLHERRQLVHNLAIAAREQHPHVYRFQIASQTTSHLKVIKAAYRQMTSQVMHLLTKGMHKSYAEETKKPFKLDKEERKKLAASIAVATDNLAHQLKAQAKKSYAFDFRKGKTEGVRKIKGALASLPGGYPDNQVLPSDEITGEDLKILNGWYDFHDEAADGLSDDIDERMDAVLDADYDTQEDFEAEARDQLGVEDYRLPMYAWMGFTVAESGQVAAYDDFNGDVISSGQEEWKYKWMTAEDDDVCSICEAYGEMDERYLDEWPEDPGDVHVYCRCDLEPIPPEMPIEEVESAPELMGLGVAR